MSPQDQDKGRFPLKQVSRAARPTPPRLRAARCGARRYVQNALRGTIPSLCFWAATCHPSQSGKEARRERQRLQGCAAAHPSLALVGTFLVALLSPACALLLPLLMPPTPPLACLQRDDAINAGFAWFREKGLIPANDDDSDDDVNYAEAAGVEW